KEDAATLSPGGIERPLHGLKGDLVNEGSHQGLSLQWIAKVLGSNAVIGRFEALQQLVVDTAVGDDTADSRAALPACSHGPKQNARECHPEISLVTDHHRIVTPQLQQTATQARRHFGRYDVPHTTAPRGTDERQASIGDEPVADLSTSSQHVQQA